jgi:hypothetical protein
VPRQKQTSLTKISVPPAPSLTVLANQAVELRPVSCSTAPSESVTEPLVVPRRR